MIILMRRHNVEETSGGNRVWKLEQHCGKPMASDLKSKRLLRSHTLRKTFDALVVLDREVKHEACPVVARDASAPAFRDVLTVEVRRPRMAPRGGGSRGRPGAAPQGD